MDFDQPHGIFDEFEADDKENKLNRINSSHSHHSIQNIQVSNIKVTQEPDYSKTHELENSCFENIMALEGNSSSKSNYS